MYKCCVNYLLKNRTVSNLSQIKKFHRVENKNCIPLSFSSGLSKVGDSDGLFEDDFGRVIGARGGFGLPRYPTCGSSSLMEGDVWLNRACFFFFFFFSFSCLTKENMFYQMHKN